MTGAKLPMSLKWTDLLVIALTALIGSVFVLVLATRGGPTYSSTALINGGPGTTAAGPENTSTDITSRYVATELIYLDNLTDLIADNITKEVGVENPPPVTSSQDSNTNVIKMTVVGTSPEQAAAMATSAANTYINNWKSRITDDVNARQSALVGNLAKVSDKLAKLTLNKKCEGGAKAECESLASVVKEFQKDRVRIAFETADTPNFTRFVQLPTPEAALPTSSAKLLAVMGFIFGGAIGVLIVYLMVRRRQRLDPPTLPAAQSPAAHGKT